MIPLLSLHTKAQNKLAKAFLFKNQYFSVYDMDHYWPQLHKRFSFTKLFSSFIEDRRYDTDLMHSPDDEDFRDNILNTLYWYDEETYESGTIEADEEFSEFDNYEMGYHNLSASQLHFEMMQHLLLWKISF